MRRLGLPRRFKQINAAIRAWRRARGGWLYRSVDAMRGQSRFARMRAVVDGK